MRVLILGGTEFISLHPSPTFDWYVREGLDRREIDFSLEDRILHAAS